MSHKYVNRSLNKVHEFSRWSAIVQFRSARYCIRRKGLGFNWSTERPPLLTGNRVGEKERRGKEREGKKEGKKGTGATVAKHSTGGGVLTLPRISQTIKSL